MKPIIGLFLLTFLAFASPLSQADTPGEFALHYHLMHPGGNSRPGDPNAAFCLDGVYHLHYILEQSWQGKKSFSFVHVTSPDMLHWAWHPTTLQPAFTGHGMFSGTGFLTKEGKPAVVYHGQASDKNWIAVAKDRQLSAWEEPMPIEGKNADGTIAEVARYWDPDLFRVDDTYYALSGGAEQELFRSDDLKHWTYVGPFLSHQPEDVTWGEDISCPNFFPIGNEGKWMLLCISHSHGCRYYLGRWDAEREQFVPESHQRMNWQRHGQPPHRGDPPQWALQQVDFFAPESVLAADGRRVMWAWLPTLDVSLAGKTLQSLPRELSLSDDGTLRMRPLQELEGQRRDAKTFEDITLAGISTTAWGHHQSKIVTNLSGEAHEIRLTVAREQAARKRLGLRVFAHPGAPDTGTLIVVDPAKRTLTVGDTSAPFAVADLPEGEDLELRVFVDKYLIEVFANDRQVVVGTDLTGWRQGQRGVAVYAYGRPTTFKNLETWTITPTTAGFHQAMIDRVWEPRTE